jgi:17beta-estradiol 17-dehydrogenase / very-long-chain 3-oxoacyl-CoA reductase
MDVKDKNLLKFLFFRLGPLFAFIFAVAYFADLNKDPIRLVGYGTIVYILINLLALLANALKQGKKPTEYGKWAIVTGATSGIGEAFAYELAAKDMNVLIISRSEEKLEKVKYEIITKYKVQCRYIVHNFEEYPAPKFEQELIKVCEELTQNGGIGLLVNNVGVANEIPELYHLLNISDIQRMVTVNINSTLHMTYVVLPFMLKRKSGCIISVSSASSLHPTPMLSVYSATKSFMAQFSRSLHYEYKEHGIDVLCLLPYYVISNMFKRGKPTLVAPAADRVARESLEFLGTRVQVYPYWMHRVIGTLAQIYPFTATAIFKVMKRNRDRALAKMNTKKSE